MSARVMPGRGVSSSGAWLSPHHRGVESGNVAPLRGSRYAVSGRGGLLFAQLRRGGQVKVRARGVGP